MASRKNKNLLPKGISEDSSSKISSFFPAGVVVNWGSNVKSISMESLTSFDGLSPEVKNYLTKPQALTFTKRRPIFEMLVDKSFVTIGMVASMPADDFAIFEKIATAGASFDLARWKNEIPELDEYVRVAREYNRLYPTKRQLSLWDVYRLTEIRVKKMLTEISHSKRTEPSSSKAVDYKAALEMEAKLKLMTDEKLALELKLDVLRSQLAGAKAELKATTETYETTKILIKNAPLVKVKTLRIGVRKRGWLHTDPRMPAQCVNYLLNHPVAYASWILHYQQHHKERSWWKLAHRDEVLSEVEAKAGFQADNLALFERTYRENFEKICSVMEARPDTSGYSRHNLKVAHGISGLKAKKEIVGYLFEGQMMSPQTIDCWRCHPDIYTKAMFDRDCAIKHCVADITAESWIYEHLGGIPAVTGYNRTKKPKPAHKPKDGKKKRRRRKNKKKNAEKKGTPTPIGKRKTVVPGVVKATPSDVGNESLFRGVDETNEDYAIRVIEYNGNDFVVLPCSHKYFAVAGENLGQVVPAELTALLTTYNRCQWGSLTFKYEAAASMFKGGEMGLIFVPLENGEPTMETINSLFNTRMQVKSPDHKRVPASARISSMTVPHIGGSRPIHGAEGVIGWFVVYPREPSMSLNAEGQATDEPYTGLLGHITVSFRGLGQYRTNVTSPDNGLFSLNKYELVAEPYVWKVVTRSDGTRANISPLLPVAPPSLARAINNTETVGGSVTPNAPSSSSSAAVNSTSIPKFRQIKIKRDGEDFIVLLAELLVAVVEVAAEVVGELPTIMKVFAEGVELVSSLVDYVGPQFADKVSVVQQANGQATSGLIAESHNPPEGFVTSVRHGTSTTSYTDAWEAFVQSISPAASPWHNIWEILVQQCAQQGVAPMGYSWVTDTPTPQVTMSNTFLESNLEDFPVVKTVPFPSDLTPAQASLSGSDLSFLPWRTTKSIPNKAWRPSGMMSDLPERAFAFDSQGRPHRATFLIFEPADIGDDFNETNVTFACVKDNGEFEAATFETRENWWAVWGVEKEMQESDSTSGDDEPQAALFTLSYKAIGCIPAAATDFKVTLPPYGPGSGAVTTDATPQGVITGIIRRDASDPEKFSIAYDAICELFARDENGNNFQFCVNDTNRTVFQIRSDF